MDKKKIFFVILVLVVFVGFIWNKRLSNKLHKDGIKTTGKIINYEHLRQANYLITYNYRIEDSLFTGYVETGISKCYGQNSSGFKEVIYSKSDPSISDINLGECNKDKKSRLYY